MIPSAPQHGSQAGGAVALPPRNRVGRLCASLAQALLLAMVIVASWTFGGVLAEIQVWLFAAMAAVFACWLVRQAVERQSARPVPLAAFPLMIAVGWGAWQLLPLDRSTASMLSPAGAQVRQRMLPQDASSDGSLSEKIGVAQPAARQPLSLYPALTRHDLALLALAAAMLLAATQFVRGWRAALWCCGAIAANGGAIAFYELFQRLKAGDPGQWHAWRLSLTEAEGVFGPFINRNNAGGFLTLCLAAAIGLSVWTAGGRAARDDGDDWDRPALPWRSWLRGALSQINGLTVAALGLSALIVAGLLCTASRGAGLAAAAGALLTFVVILARRRRVGPRLAVTGLAITAGLALAVWLGMSGLLRARLATLSDLHTAGGNRIPHWQDGLKAVPDYWRVGSGLGTYRYAYSPYQQRPDRYWFIHAENQYLETLVEGGAVGLGLFLATLALVTVATWRLLKPDSGARCLGLAATGAMALGSQAMHNLVDFDLSIPANMLLFALICGAVCGYAGTSAAGRRFAGMFAVPVGRGLSVAVAVVGLALMVWGGAEMRGQAGIDAAMHRARHALTGAKASPGALASAIADLDAALVARPDNAEGHYRATELWINLYRVRAAEQLRREGAGGDDAQRWRLTLPEALHRQAHALGAAHQESTWEQFCSQPVIRDHLLPALRHAVQARDACPLLPEVHLTIAELCVLVTAPSSDEVHLERARRVTPGNGELLFWTGLLEFQAGRLDQACADWRRSMALESKRDEQIYALAGARMALAEIVERLMPDSPAALIDVAREKYGGKDQTVSRWMIADRAEQVLAASELPAAERYYYQGAIQALKGLYSKAIESYSRAVGLRWRIPAWHYDLALLLHQQGLLSKAHEEAVICVRLDPGNARYQKLLEQVNHARLTASTGAKPKEYAQ